MRYVNDTTLQVGHLDGELRPPNASMTVVVKATLDPVHEGTATLANEQRFTHGTLHWDDDPERSPCAPSDFAPFKPQGECFVIGRAWAPGGRPCRVVALGFGVGTIQKEVAVLGDRTFSGPLSQISAPAPFSSMELSLERAHRGPRRDSNSYGSSLPNLEQPSDPTTARDDRPSPVQLGPLPATWPARLRLAGTYDDRYLEERWPYFPADLEWAYFLEAPEDQRLPAGHYWRGDEAVWLRGLSPHQPEIQTRLPGVRARAFLVVQRPDGHAFEEVTLRLDTITIDGASGQLLLTWRGVSERPRGEVEQIQHLYIGADELDAPASAETHRARFERRLVEEDGESVDAEGTAPPPSPIRPVGPPAPAEALEQRERVVRLLSESRDLTELDLSGSDLHALDLSGCDLRGSILTSVSLRGANLREARLEGVTLERSDLTGADLSGAHLDGADLSSCSAEGALFTLACLEDATLDEASFVAADFELSDCSRCSMLSADLSRACFKGAVLTEADLDSANLDDADLEGATLINTTLADGSAARARFDHADLTGLRASRLRAEGASLRSVRAEDSCWDGAELSRADFGRSQLARAQLADAVLLGTNFDECVLRDARLERVAGTALTARRADLFGASFEHAQIDFADFRGASLFGAELWGAKTDDALFELADLTQTKLEPSR